MLGEGYAVVHDPSIVKARSVMIVVSIQHVMHEADHVSSFMDGN